VRVKGKLMTHSGILPKRRELESKEREPKKKNKDKSKKEENVIRDRASTRDINGNRVIDTCSFLNKH